MHSNVAEEATLLCMAPQLCIYVADKHISLPKSRYFFLFAGISSGYYGRVESQVLLLETHSYRSIMLSVSNAGISKGYTNCTNFGAVVSLPW